MVELIAEIGANHNGELSLAKELVHAAKEAGAHGVKWQWYEVNDLLVDKERVVTSGAPGKERRERVEDLFRKVTLADEEHIELFHYAQKLGIEAFTTPFTPRVLPLLEELGVTRYKVASSDVCYEEMLIQIAATHKPVILSTGKSTLGEIDRALDLLEGSPVMLLHCVASYPTPVKDLNLRLIATYKELFPSLSIGFSDHSIGITAPLLAVALGATMIEKHFTLDRTLEGPDHWFSLDPKQWRHLTEEVSFAQDALQRSRKRVMPSEVKEREISVRSLVLKRGLEKGDVIQECDLDMKRPGWGIHPSDKHKVIGLRLTQGVAAHSVLTWDHFSSQVVDRACAMASG